MQVNVGTVLTLKERRYFCRGIESNKRTFVAREEDARTYSGTKSVGTPRIMFISQTNAEFVAGDIITIEWERLDLKEINGVEWMTLYTYYNVRKEAANGLKAVESVDGQTTDSETQSSREGSADREGVG